MSSFRSLSMRSRNLTMFCSQSYVLSILSLVSAAFTIATAWIALPQQKQRSSSSLIHWNDYHKVTKCNGFPTTNMTRCDTLSDTSEENVVITSTTTSLPPCFRTDSVQYELMNIPDRGKLETHAIYGSLQKSNCIEQYDVYRARRLGPPVKPSNTTGEAIPDVVAVIAVGENLDGHTGIVHGGIIALIIDDVLGFGYFAVLMDEFESYENKNHGDVDNYTDVVAVTANLNINFRAPMPSGCKFIVEATLVSDGNALERRTNKSKFHWDVQVRSLDRSLTFCQATSLYVIPKQVQNVLR